MNHFPLAQLTGADVVTITAPPGATVRRHILEDDHTPRNGGDASSKPFKPGKRLKVHTITPRQARLSRKFRTHIDGKPTIGQRILDELHREAPLNYRQICKRIDTTPQHLCRGLLVLLSRKLIVRAGTKRHYTYTLNTEQPCP